MLCLMHVICSLYHYKYHFVETKKRTDNYSQGGVAETKCKFFFLTDKGQFFKKLLKVYQRFLDRRHR